MTTTYKGFRIDYANCAAIIYKGSNFIKGFASDETKTGLSGLDKAKKYIDNV